MGGPCAMLSLGHHLRPSMGRTQFASREMDGPCTTPGDQPEKVDHLPYTGHSLTCLPGNGWPVHDARGPAGERRPCARQGPCKFADHGPRTLRRPWAMQDKNGRAKQGPHAVFCRYSAFISVNSQKHTNDGLSQNRLFFCQIAKSKLDPICYFCC